MSTYTCEGCGGTFTENPDWDAMAEATAAFTKDELVDAAVVCEDCWQKMRAALPELDARYRWAADGAPAVVRTTGQTDD